MNRPPVAAVLAPLEQRLLSVPYTEVSYAQRGFDLRACDAGVRQRGEAYFAAFLDGYHHALRTPGLEALAAWLDTSLPDETRGFGYEGAGMYLGLRDMLLPLRQPRLPRFVQGPAKRYGFITLIGRGLALARLPWMRWHPTRSLARLHLDPLDVSFALDGYGFHEGFFHHRQTIDLCRQPRGLDPSSAHTFDQGLGRGLWFVAGAAPRRIEQAIARFPASRQPDLWSGVGLAASYAGGVHADLHAYRRVLDQLHLLAGPYAGELGLGVVLAAHARASAGTPSDWTSLACERLAGQTFTQAADLAQHALDSARRLLAATPAGAEAWDGYAAARHIIRGTLSVRWAA